MTDANRILLGVNIDHVATLRQARGTRYPDPVKAALESMVRYMAMELGPAGIRVHAVSPGPILTRAASGIASFDELMDSAIRKSPLGRLVTLEEIAGLTTFLCSDAASGMTGQTLYVDAGYHAVD